MKTMAELSLRRPVSAVTGEGLEPLLVAVTGRQASPSIALAAALIIGAAVIGTRSAE